MTELIMPTILGGLFLVIGLALLVLPARVLLKWDRRTGYWIYKRSPSEEVGLRRATIFYRAFGILILAFIVCWYAYMAVAVIRDAGGLDGIGTVIHRAPITSIGISSATCWSG
jgi:hypothetical protein